MSSSTTIEWTDASWNPVTGCDRVSPGCAHCYALDLAARLKGMGQARYQRDGDPKTSGPGFGVTLHPDRLAEPLRWRKPRKVFVNSMSDLFHELVPSEYIARVFAVMAQCPQHTFQVLTKRSERMRAMLRNRGFFTEVEQKKRPGEPVEAATTPSYLPNVWLGTSIENRRFVGRADLLRETPAAVRFISAEPLLGPLLFPEDSWHWTSYGERHWDDNYIGPMLDLTDIDWLIVGGESGPKARPMDPTWVRYLRDACLGRPDRETPATRFFFKQWGGRTPKAGGRELDGRTWDEMPAAAQAVAS